MIPVNILTQPDDVTCGPTSLQAVYNYYGDNIPLQQVINEVSSLEDGGTLAVLLGSHALKRGYSSAIYTYNLKMFDPTWLKNVEQVDLISKLEEQLKYKRGKKFSAASFAYIDYIKLGGKLHFKDLTHLLINEYFKRKIPILAGLSATYLYQSMREYQATPKKIAYDDIRGYPQGHFVVLCGYDSEQKNIIVADPYKENPISKNNYYSVDIPRLINSIMLGVITYDANFLIVEPKKKS